MYCGRQKYDMHVNLPVHNIHKYTMCTRVLLCTLCVQEHGARVASSSSSTRAEESYDSDGGARRPPNVILLGGGECVLCLACLKLVLRQSIHADSLGVER